jgi:hypothetical protein
MLQDRDVKSAQRCRRLSDLAFITGLGDDNAHNNRQLRHGLEGKCARIALCAIGGDIKEATTRGMTKSGRPRECL